MSALFAFLIFPSVSIKEEFTLIVRRRDLFLRMEVKLFTLDTKHHLQLTKNP